MPIHLTPTKDKVGDSIRECLKSLDPCHHGAQTQEITEAKSNKRNPNQIKS